MKDAQIVVSNDIISLLSVGKKILHPFQNKQKVRYISIFLLQNFWNRPLNYSLSHSHASYNICWSQDKSIVVFHPDAPAARLSYSPCSSLENSSINSRCLWVKFLYKFSDCQALFSCWNYILSINLLKDHVTILVKANYF